MNILSLWNNPLYLYKYSYSWSLFYLTVIYIILLSNISVCMIYFFHSFKLLDSCFPLTPPFWQSLLFHWVLKPIHIINILLRCKSAILLCVFYLSHIIFWFLFSYSVPSFFFFLDWVVFLVFHLSTHLQVAISLLLYCSI